MGHDQDLSRGSRARLALVVAATCASGVLAGLHPTAASARLVPFVVVAVAFMIAGRHTVRLDLGRHRCTMTAAPVVLTAALGTLPPILLGCAAVLGEATTLARLRVGPQKMVVNLAARWSAAVVGGAVFEVLEPLGGDPTSVAVRSVVAALAYTGFNALTVSAAIAAATGRPMLAVLHQMAMASGIVALAGGSVGASGRALASLSVAAPALLLPMLVVVWLASRAAVAQRDQHLRMVELYQAVAETMPLAEQVGALAKMCTQTARLASVDTAVVVMAWPGTAASGVAMADGKIRPLPPALAAEHLAYGTGAPSRRVPSGEVPPAIARVVGQRDLMIASHAGSDGAAVALLTAMADDADATPEQKLETLVAYASHVALIATNFGLYTEAQEALRHQLDLNQRKDEFVATLSHELRTPLTVTIGALEAVTRYRDRMDTRVRAELLADASTQAHRLRELIDDLLTVAAGPSPTATELVPLADLFATIRATITPSLASRMTITCSDVVDRRAVTHQRSVDRILVNLLTNAAKYGGPGPIELTMDVVGNELVVVVADHGPGIPEHLAPLAFDRFVQLDQSDTRQGAGVGLGLYLCRKLADEVGASLTLTTTPGGGATFTLRIPLEPVPTGGVPPPASVIAPPRVSTDRASAMTAG